jgi:hypothetical protein
MPSGQAIASDEHRVEALLPTLTYIDLSSFRRGMTQ